MKIIIEQNFVMNHPWHLLPLLLGTHIPGLAPIRGKSLGNGRLPRRAFGPSGFDGIELSLLTSQLFGGNLRRKWRINRRLLRGLKNKEWPIYAIHGCFERLPSFFKHLTFNLANRNAITLHALESQLDVAHRLCPAGVVMILHAGLVPPGHSHQQAIDNVVANLRDVLPILAEHQIHIALENMPFKEDVDYLGAHHPHELMEIIQRLGSDQIGINFDWGHANTHSIRNPRYLEDTIRLFGKAIVYCHIHFNFARDLSGLKRPRRLKYTQYDEHLPLNRIPPKDFQWFEDSIHLLLESSRIWEIGLIGLELPQRKVFFVRPILPAGSTFWEHMESIRIIRGIVERCSSRRSERVVSATTPFPTLPNRYIL